MKIERLQEIQSKNEKGEATLQDLIEIAAATLISQSNNNKIIKKLLENNIELLNKLQEKTETMNISVAKIENAIAPKHYTIFPSYELEDIDKSTETS